MNLTTILLATAVGIFVGLIFRVAAVLLLTVILLVMALGSDATSSKSLADSTFGALRAIVFLQVGYLVGLALRSVLRRHN